MDYNVHIHKVLMTVRMLREELQLLQEPGSYVGEVVKVMGKSKVLVKVSEIFIFIFILDFSLLGNCFFSLFNYYIFLTAVIISLFIKNFFHIISLAFDW